MTEKLLWGAVIATMTVGTFLTAIPKIAVATYGEGLHVLADVTIWWADLRRAWRHDAVHRAHWGIPSVLGPGHVREYVGRHRKG